MTIKDPDANDYSGGLNELLGWSTSGSRGKSSNKASRGHQRRHEKHHQQQLTSDLEASPQYNETPQYAPTEMPTPVQLEGTGTDTNVEQPEADANAKQVIVGL